MRMVKLYYRRTWKKGNLEKYKLIVIIVADGKLRRDFNKYIILECSKYISIGRKP